MKTISIIIPAHNEEKNISLIFEKLTEVFRSFDAEKYAFNVLFINDGSTDGSAKEIEKLAENNQQQYEVTLKSIRARQADIDTNKAIIREQ